jgi:hypothetical protein
MTDKILYKFPTGLEVTGTFEEIEKVAKAIGAKLDYSVFVGKVPRGYYPSESRGVIKISEMSEFHLRRALLKRAKDYYTEIFDPKDSVKIFLDKFTALPLDAIIFDLFTELSNKK